MVPRNLGFRFTLVSYNILSQSLLNDHNYLYTNCNPKDLEWPRRGHRIVTELLSNKADIICLQEVECEHLNSLYKPKLSYHGYDCLYKKKTGYKLDGCAIFYKRNLFHLLNFKGIEFNKTSVTKLLNRDNVGIIAVLEPKLNESRRAFSNNQSNDTNNEVESNLSANDQQQLIIANTHLIFNPKRSDIKLAQLKLFLSELDKISFKHHDNGADESQHHPTILCGDLNSVPDSEINDFIMRRKIIKCDGTTNTTTLLNESNHQISDDDKDPESNSRQSSMNDGMERQQNQKDPSNSPAPDAIEDEEDHDLRRRFNNLHNSSHPFKFKSVYPKENDQGQPYVSTLSSCIVDYIFYTPKQLKLLSYRELLTDEDLKNIGPIPNFLFPSDHLILKAKFLLE